MIKRALIVVLTLLGIIAAGVAAVLMTVPGAAVAAPAHQPQSCTPAYGQCQVTVYRMHQRNGVVKIWTCFAQPPVKPGASNIWIAVDDCYRP